MGTTEGFVEIELKGPLGGRNVVIRRKLTAKSKTSSFTMDGRQASGKEVQAMMAELNIQVDSLWYVPIYATLSSLRMLTAA
jgi:chromosome segregation ATPase